MPEFHVESRDCSERIENEYTPIAEVVTLVLIRSRLEEFSLS